MNPTAPNPATAATRWLPPAQILLLRACLAEGDTSIAAWRAWQQQVALDAIDLASLRLIPLLLERLRHAGVADAALGRYQGIQRKYWYENQLLFRQAADVVQLFAAAGIPTLFLKGVPLAQLYYDRPGLRPMSDFDLLVPYNQAAHAMAVLQSAGWLGTLEYTGLRRPVPHPYLGGHSWAFKNHTGGHVDLHWRVLKTSFAPDADAAFWRAAEKFSFAGVDCLTLNPADHLLHTCAHGLPANPLASIRWLADATMILRRRTLDWERLLTQTQAHQLSVVMHAALTCLRTTFAGSVPESVLQRLAAITPAPWEQAELAVLLRPGKSAQRQQRLRYGFHRFRHTMPGMAARSRLMAYFIFLQTRWDLAHRWEIPLDVLRRLWGYLGQRLTRSASVAP
ncbi:MAG: nucleotidyltransferase family protein [Opitutaceae bacterium]|nr:nucleotidyltransferase family protein [Opitutaceae bacterium]MBP9912285.1 nucleotidyltransferase family protein [Opitutaceae bacterium]